MRPEKHNLPQESLSGKETPVHTEIRTPDQSSIAAANGEERRR